MFSSSLISTSTKDNGAKPYLSNDRAILVSIISLFTFRINIRIKFQFFEPF